MSPSDPPVAAPTPYFTPEEPPQNCDAKLWRLICLRVHALHEENERLRAWVAAPTPLFVMPNRKFRNKPRVIEAEQFWPDQVLPFHPKPYVAFHDGDFYVITAHGQRAVLAPGDWVIPEPSGPHVIAFAAYPVKPDIFDATYERVAAPTPSCVFHPMQTDRVQSHLPAAVALRAYEVYCELYGEQPAMVDVAHGCRGGFSVNELLAFLYARSFPRAEWLRRFEDALERRPR